MFHFKYPIIVDSTTNYDFEKCFFDIIYLTTKNKLDL